MPTPNFMIVGSYISGTTFTVNLLKQNPDIFIRPIKPKFKYFEFYGIEETESFDEYLHGFDASVGKKAIGEKNTRYICNEWVPPQIAHHFPGITLIFLLRDPLQRAYSSYLEQVQNRIEFLSFETALKREPERTAKSYHDSVRFGYIERGRYMQQINTYLPLFPRENLKFILSEDLFADSEKMIREICTFLDVDPNFNFQFRVGQRNNKSAAHQKHYPKYMPLFLSTIRASKQLKKKRGSRVMSKILRRWPQTLVKPEPSPEAMQYLRDSLCEDIDSLGHFLNRDLSHWYQI